MDKSNKFEKLTDNAKQVIYRSYELAREFHSKEVLPHHIFIALLNHDQGLASRFLKSIGVDVDKTIESVKLKLPKTKKSSTDPLISDQVKDLIKNAFRLSASFGHIYVGTEHILLALLDFNNLEFVKEFEKAGFGFDSLRDRLFAYATYAPGIFMKSQVKEKDENEVVNYFGRNLNQLATEGKFMPIVGREEEIRRMIKILSRQTKNNPILVGDAGVGKTAIIEGFVQKIIRGEVPYSLKNTEVFQINITAIIAGSKVRGDVEQRLLALIEEVSGSPNKILFIDEIHMIIGAGATGADRTMDIANILKPHLTDGSIRIIGATTIDEYRRYFEEDSALSRRFQPINVDEISVKDGIKILKEIKFRLEEYHGVKITPEAVEQSVKLSSRFIADRYLPDKAIDVLDEASASEKIEREEMNKSGRDYSKELFNLQKEKSKAIKDNLYEEALKIRKAEDEIKELISSQKKINDDLIKKGKFIVDEEDVKKVISEWTSIPIESLSVSEIRSLKNLKNRLSSNIIGQKEAVERISSVLKRARLGLSDELRPLASFLFLGPTGVGKTEMGKEIARQFFGSEKSLFQVDMSEFMEQHSVAKIIGAPPGYVGYQEGGQLSEKIRKKPYSVILFDEIEKAHPDLLNILLQALEEGQITDSKGRKISFKNSIIIMTSNIGASDISRDKVLGFKVSNQDQQIEEAYELMRDRLIEELKKTLKPEFLNRIDEVVIFRGLNSQDAKKISKVLLKKLVKRMKERKINLEYEDNVIDFIAKKGFSEEYGARNIRRKIQEYIENTLSDALLESGKREVDARLELKDNKINIIIK